MEIDWDEDCGELSDKSFKVLMDSISKTVKEDIAPKIQRILKHYYISDIGADSVTVTQMYADTWEVEDEPV